MNTRKILVNTPFSSRVFGSMQEVMQAYGLSYRKLKQLLETGATLEDGKTTFDVVYECETEEGLE